AGDVKSFKLEDLFSAAFLSGSFDHIPKNERLESLKNVNRHLRIGGRLVFDIYIGGMKDSPLSLIDTIKKGDYVYQRSIGTKTLPNDTIDVLLVYEIYKEGKLIEKIEQPSTAVITTREEVHNLLENAGFSIKKEYRDYDFSPYTKQSPLLIVEAEKVGN
ncbi:MAG: hypothetical protein JSV04_07765, partial [Candidatus Heimdallarchaeota archaeon]